MTRLAAAILWIAALAAAVSAQTVTIDDEKGGATSSAGVFEIFHLSSPASSVGSLYSDGDNVPSSVPATERVFVVHLAGGVQASAMGGELLDVRLYHRYSFVSKADAETQGWIEIADNSPDYSGGAVDSFDEYCETQWWYDADAYEGAWVQWRWVATLGGGGPTASNESVTLLLSDSASPTNTPTDTPVPTNTHTPTATWTPSNTPTDTPTATATPTPTNTHTPTATNTATNTGTPTPTVTGTTTPTHTFTPTHTPTDTPTATNTPTPTHTWTPTNTATHTPTFTPTVTGTTTPTHTHTPTNTGTPTSTPTPTTANTNTPTPTATTPAGQLEQPSVDCYYIDYDCSASPSEVMIRADVTADPRANEHHVYIERGNPAPPWSEVGFLVKYGSSFSVEFNTLVGYDYRVRVISKDNEYSDSDEGICSKEPVAVPTCTPTPVNTPTNTPVPTDTPTPTPSNTPGWAGLFIKLDIGVGLKLYGVVRHATY